MQSSNDPHADNTFSTQSTPRKRRLQEQLYKHSIAPPLSIHDPSTPASKKLKTSSTSPTTMSKSMAVGTQSRPFDSTSHRTAFEPHRGAKKLVIKNLKISSPDVTKYYADTWRDLETAVGLILNGERTQTPLEKLCKGVEMTCRRGKADELFERFRDLCKAHMEKHILPAIQSSIGTGSVDALRIVHDYWIIWYKRTTLLRSIFSYLDRSYLLNQKDLPQLEDLSIQQFRHAIFGKSKTSSKTKLGEDVVTGMCELVRQDRDGIENFDGVLLKDSIGMLHIIGTYDQFFEPLFFAQATSYYNAFVKERGSSPLRSYISSCDSLLSRESTRCDRYNFNSSTKVKLLAMAHRVLIEFSSDILLEVEGVAKLVDNNDIQSLKTLYTLLGLSKITSQLKSPFEKYIKKIGGSIIKDQEKVDEMVVRLLVFKRSLDVIIRDAFARDEKFGYCLREAFGNFMNDRKNISAYGTNNSKVGEMIAKYMDLLLRGGVKAVPRELVSDDKDRATAEKEGQASTGDEDAELDRQLEQGLELFRFIEGKDVFEAFYKKDLARRLLMARSASQDAERSMLAKLKVECGTSFTHNLEQMFKDQDISRDEMITYKQHLSNTSKTTMDLQVSVLSAAAWPTYPDIAVKLPVEVARHLEKYDRHYKHKHQGRKLTWKHSLAHSVVKAQFNKGTKELLVSSFQAIVLVLFNDTADNAPISYTTIREATNLPDAELIRTMQSLACAKFRVLTKHPKGREVNHTDTFTVNLTFTDAKFRIKINQIQLKETKEENAETHERVYQDRQYETQAAIVRIMKSRKTMGHQQLVAEVIEQTKKRGAVELGEIKKNIEKLLEKEYIEREGSNYVYVS